MQKKKRSVHADAPFLLGPSKPDPHARSCFACMEGLYVTAIVVVYGLVLVYLLWRLRAVADECAHARRLAAAYATVEQVHSIAQGYVDDAAGEGGAESDAAS